jgi:hypothetical protein
MRVTTWPPLTTTPASNGWEISDIYDERRDRLSGEADVTNRGQRRPKGPGRRPDVPFRQRTT